MLHAHVETEQRDCDGLYTGGQVYEMVTEERADEQFGELRFKNRVFTSVVSLHGYGQATVTPTGLVWHERTEEGHRVADVTWCEDECGAESWQRDHTAEAAGY